MLVCNVSLRPPRRAIAADVAEIATALDDLGSGSGQVVFATLVDDPASVGDIVDAYLGEIMLEAATATDTLTASIPLTYAADINEATAAADLLSASSAVANVTWDPATISAVTLSGGNLIVTSTSAAPDHGAHVIAASGKLTGKYYIEIACTTFASNGNAGIGVGTTASTYSGMGGGGGVTGVMSYSGSGSIYANGSSSGFSTGAHAGFSIGLAADLDNRKMWFRRLPAENWNGNATHNPATNTGGVTIPAGTMVPFCVCDKSGSVNTANFGDSPFTGAVPSGFTSGWPL